ncbi:hypothetical protein ILYODFUR_033762 [Ilyodon furcidens]|uniref:Focadhesin C-terminal domain-containing protein n=1 Tax=Ilyodon furcidens TaxID=33524 RepID=A0ABV0UAN2_9TELE
MNVLLPQRFCPGWDQWFILTIRNNQKTIYLLIQVLSYSVACVSVSAFSGGLIDAAKAEEVLNTLRTLTEESQQTPGFSLALGLVVHGLSVSGHGKAEDIHPRLLAAWVKILLAEVKACISISSSNPLTLI